MEQYKGRSYFKRVSGEEKQLYTLAVLSTGNANVTEVRELSEPIAHAIARSEGFSRAHMGGASGGDMFGKIVNGMVEAGLVRWTGEKRGCHARVFEATEAGRAELDRLLKLYRHSEYLMGHFRPLVRHG